MSYLKRGAGVLLGGYFAAALFFLTTILLARLYAPHEYALVAFALAYGGVGMVVVNLGSDVALTKILLACKDLNEEVAVVLNNLRLRLAGLGFVLAAAIAVVSFLQYSVKDGAITLLLIVWVSSQGLFPNSQYEVTSSIAIQQKVIFVERLLGLLIVLTKPLSLVVEFEWVAAGLFLARVGSCYIQYRLWFLRTTNDKRLWVAKNLRPWEGKGFEAGISAKITLSLLFNATVSYYNQISLEFYGLKADLSAYSLCFQLFSIVSIFQGTVLRLISKQVNKSALENEVLRSQVVKKGGAMVAASFVLAVLAVGCLQFGLAALGSPWSDITTSMVLALGAWVVVVGWGQVVTRYLLAMGFEKSYLRVSAVGAALTMIIGWKAVPLYGGIGVSFTLLAVHSTMIFVYSFLLFRNARRW